MSKWVNLSAEKQGEIYEKVAEVYEKYEYPEGLADPGCIGEYVNVLMANQKQDALRPLTITGTFGPDERDLANELKKDLKDAVKEVEDAQVNISVKRGVGAAMGEIKDASRIDGSGDVVVKHEAGQVILLDFWATWCPPCEGPMANNQRMLEDEDNKDNWGDNVRVIGLSIDQTAEAVESHVDEKGWNSVEHYHISNGKCDAAEQFGVKGLPHVVLIDKQGIIAFVGHPDSRNLEEDINTLLDGRLLQGPGTTAAGGDLEGCEFNDDLDDAQKVKELIEEFNELSKKHCQTEQTMEAAEGMQRAFCVLVHEQKFDCRTKQLKNNLTNYQFLVGSQDKIDDLKAILEPFRDAKYALKVVQKEQVII